MGDWEHADQSDYEQYLLQQQAELPLHTLNDMTLDERITEYIEWQNSEFDKRLMVDAHLEIIKLRAENARLDAALLHTSGQLTDAINRIAELQAELSEAQYAYGLLTKQADANYHRAREAEAQLVKYQTVTVARRCKQEIICDGDGDSPDWCRRNAEWEVQRMDEDGSAYSHLCSDHLDDYQKWASEAGYSPMVFEIDD